jgi:rhamnosyltransferase
MKVLAGIVLYNPDICRLEENLNAIRPQVDKLLLVDNHSQNIEDIETLFGTDGKTSFIKNKINCGIATALNQIMFYAKEHNYTWILTLDQDSVVANNLIDVYSAYTTYENIGVISCRINDRNFSFKREENICCQDEEKRNVITSGSLINVSAWEAVGGFDDLMFIDAVDFDFCASLRARSYKIIKTYKTHIIHEVGHSEVVKLFGKEYLKLNHSPFRYYYMARNYIYFARKHRKDRYNLRFLLIPFRIMLIVSLYEKNKNMKLTKLLAGAKDGLFMKIKDTKIEK